MRQFAKLYGLNKSSICTWLQTFFPKSQKDSIQTKKETSQDNVQIKQELLDPDISDPFDTKSFAKGFSKSDESCFIKQEYMESDQQTNEKLVNPEQFFETGNPEIFDNFCETKLDYNSDEYVMNGNTPFVLEK